MLGLEIRVASRVDTEFRYGVCIVDMGLIATTLFADNVPILRQQRLDELRLTDLAARSV